MAKFNGLRNFGKTTGGRLARRGQKNGSISELGETVTDTALTAGQVAAVRGGTDTFGKVTSTVETVGGLGMLGADMVIPYGLAGIGGGIGLLGKGANGVGGLVGANDLGSGMINSSKRLKSGLAANFTERTIGSTAMGTQFAGAVDTMMTPFYKATSALNGLTGFFDWRHKSHLSRATGHAEKAAVHVEEALGHVATTNPHLTEEMTHHLNNMLKAARANHTESLATYREGLNELKKADLGKGAIKAIGKVEKHIEKQVSLLGKANTAKSMATGQHNTFEAVNKSTLQQGASGVFLSLSSAAETAVTIKDTLSDVDAFRSLVADIKGTEKDQVTSGDALFGELPYAGNIARKALLISAPPRAVLEAINQVFNIKWITGKHIPIALFMAPMLASQAIGALTSGSILDAYKTLKKNELAGIPNEGEDYAKLIGLANKQLHSRLGAESNFAKEVGRIYASKQVSVKQTLADAQNGVIDQLIYHIQHENIGQEVDAQSPHAHPEMPSPKLAQVDEVHANAAHMIHEQPANDAEAKQQPQSFVDRLAGEASTQNKGVS